MLIEPNSDIILIRGCPLLPGYKNTFYFGSKSEQYEHFTTKYQKVSFAKYSYQRHTVGSIKLNAVADDLFDVTYMLFKNTSYEDKWFYAFVLTVEYVSNEVCVIEYEIDELQSWFIDEIENNRVNPCFVEREHIANDTIGANLVDEGLDIGEYVIHEEKYPYSGIMSMVIQYVGVGFYIPDNVEGDTAGYKFYCGTYNGCHFARIDLTDNDDLEQLRIWLTGLSADPLNDIVGVFMYPKEAFADFMVADGIDTTLPVKLFGVNRPTNHEGFVPNNKKLLTFPYVCTSLSSANDSGTNYSFELFDTAYVHNNFDATFGAYSPLQTGGNMFAFPQHYAGYQFATNLGVNASPYANCIFNTDKVLESLSGTAISAISIAISALTKNPGVAAAGTASVSALQQELLANKPVKVRGPKTQALNEARKAARSAAIQAYTDERRLAAREDFYEERDSHNDIKGLISECLSALAPTTGSCASSQAVSVSPWGCQVSAKSKTMRRHNALIIDRYFDMYGYATNRIKKPNFNVRENWTYVKTKNFSTRGSMPASSRGVIYDAHNNGITYWYKNSVFGDYSQSNNTL